MYVDNCDATNEAEGGRWRRSRHLRRVQRPRQGGTENGPSRRRMPGGTPFLSVSFLKSELYVHRLGPNRVSENSVTDRHQTDRIGPIWSSSGTVFGSVKSQIPVADTPKRCPENNTPNSLRNPVNGHLRLASVVALSSSGACGANIMLYKFRVKFYLIINRVFS